MSLSEVDMKFAGAGVIIYERGLVSARAAGVILRKGLLRTTTATTAVVSRTFHAIKIAAA